MQNAASQRHEIDPGIIVIRLTFNSNVMLLRVIVISLLAMSTYSIGAGNNTGNRKLQHEDTLPPLNNKIG